MRSIAEHFEQRYQRAQYMNKIEKEKPRLAQIIMALRVKERLAERFRKRK